MALTRCVTFLSLSGVGRGLDRDATDYFRGVVKIGEMSERVLGLTETVIRMNPAHYSAWSVYLYRESVRYLAFTHANVTGSIVTKPSWRSTPISSPSSY